MSTDVWGTIHAERKALAADLQGIADAQWATASLCTDWTVRDVLAHMSATARMTPLQFIGKFVLSGFNFASVQAQGIAAHRGGSPAETLARFNTLVNSSNHPPGPTDTWLGEVIVHSEDIRRALGIKHAYPTDAAVQVANFYKTTNLLIGAKARIAGLKLRATDADWSTGDGPEVSGPIVSLLQAMTGRTAAMDDLTGDGVATLRSRA
ncbi:MAG TPA: maleylpyruvate isomerase family mycothiol-dependent enzyme [Chloroflexota bacterium]|nr:maleylpyruvate isomerase family mycothiol-dependent enzyme [Chloroflexota bacterium]